MLKFVLLCMLLYLINQLNTLTFQMCNKILHFYVKNVCFNNNKCYQISSNRLIISNKTRSFICVLLSPLTCLLDRPNSPGKVKKQKND